jgi:hypothetical protein
MKARGAPQPPKVEVDPSGWLINNQLAQFMLMHTDEIKYMCMLGMKNYHANNEHNSVFHQTYTFIQVILFYMGQRYSNTPRRQLQFPISLSL